MYVGILKTRDILLHPGSLIAMRGFKGFLKLLFRAFSRKKYRFVNQIEETSWIYIGGKKK